MTTFTAPGVCYGGMAARQRQTGGSGGGSRRGICQRGGHTQSRSGVSAGGVQPGSALPIREPREALVHAAEAESAGKPTVTVKGAQGDKRRKSRIKIKSSTGTTKQNAKQRAALPLCSIPSLIL